MNWHLINSGSNSGMYNMDFDLDLVKKCNPGEAFFRLYRWQPYAISLGANQDLNDIKLIKANEDGIDVVKRPTGGRAILHAEELTYSVVMHTNSKLSARDLYKKISLGIVKGLSLYDHKLTEVKLETTQPDFPKILKEPAGILCYGSTAKDEIKFRGKKFVGSAQRKMDTVVLQHGSMLCGSYHRNLVKYINIGEEDKVNLYEQLINSTTELNSILNNKINMLKLSEAIVSGFEKVWSMDFNRVLELKD